MLHWQVRNCGAPWHPKKGGKVLCTKSRSCQKTMKMVETIEMALAAITSYQLQLFMYLQMALYHMGTVFSNLSFMALRCWVRTPLDLHLANDS